MNPKNMRRLVSNNAQFLLAQYYLDKAKKKARSGNITGSKALFALYEETQKKASQDFKSVLKDMKRERHRSAVYENIQSAKNANREFGGALGWARYRWQRWRLSCIQAKKSKLDKRTGKLSLLADLAADEGVDTSSEEENDEFNNRFTETVVIESLPSPPRHQLAQTNFAATS